MYKIIRVIAKNDSLNNFKPKKDEVSQNPFTKLVFTGLFESTKSSENVIDMNKEMDKRFPIIDHHIFLSHSHMDIEKARIFKKYLEQTFNVKVFLDADIWENSKDFLKELDNQYCLNTGGETYNYDKRNVTTAHVHMVLATSLLKAIDKTECVILFESENYGQSPNVEFETRSAWIYYEIMISRMIKPNHPKRMLNEQGTLRHSFQDQAFKFDPLYRLKLDDIKTNSIEQIMSIERLQLKGNDFLDKLYSL
ncbi:hypothetical protein N7603_00705 [Acholeplasma vituli]|uniref:TIR domain-containing protein n=1 Tax=Paracholeplasma vituli TaxID=69473 RepID=A0ABT2PTA9_9MOLU|nr:hypothetical protein [Paracholeplasma vituli]MCU0104181.1 hypothetical protein [Paracholeplasma vituli]